MHAETQIDVAFEAMPNASGIGLRPERLMLGKPFVAEPPKGRLRAPDISLPFAFSFTGRISAGGDDKSRFITSKPGGGETDVWEAPKSEELRTSLMAIAIMPRFCAARRDLQG